MVKNDTVGKIDLLGLSVWVDLGQNIGGVSGWDYNGAIEDQGEKMEEDWEENFDPKIRKNRDWILDQLDDLNRRPTPPSPRPEHEDRLTICHYECELVSMGSTNGSSACAYGNCKLYQRSFGNGPCPLRYKGTMIRYPKKEECGDFSCDNKVYITSSVDDAKGSSEDDGGNTVENYKPHAFSPFGSK